ncbi:unnamed protein product [Dibothriocephalus latus]|uniref:Uncharacterized protein n=1 Tax=Dibothriocephalus latus TaxID=60516 RepID=A0A3P7M708_DIBLA|nr:unnamed protein product [Dibothriocephalus latus]
MVTVKTEELCCLRRLPVTRRLDFTVGCSLDEDIKEWQLLLFSFFPRKLYVRKDSIEQVMKVFQHALFDDNKRVIYVTTPKEGVVLGEGGVF